MGASPMGQRSAQAGNGAQAIAIVRQSVELLQKAQQMAPVGGDLHKAIVDSVKKLAALAPQAEAQPGSDDTNLKAMQQSAQQSAPMQQFLRMQGAQAQPPGGGGAPAAAT